MSRCPVGQLQEEGVQISCQVLTCVCSDGVHYKATEPLKVLSSSELPNELLSSRPVTRRMGRGKLITLHLRVQ